MTARLSQTFGSKSGAAPQVPLFALEAVNAGPAANEEPEQARTLGPLTGHFNPLNANERLRQDCEKMNLAALQHGVMFGKIDLNDIGVFINAAFIKIAQNAKLEKERREACDADRMFLALLDSL